MFSGARTLSASGDLQSKLSSSPSQVETKEDSNTSSSATMNNNDQSNVGTSAPSVERENNYLLWLLEEFPRICLKCTATGNFAARSKGRKDAGHRLSASHSAASFISSHNAKAEIFQITVLPPETQEVGRYEHGAKVTISTFKGEYWTAGRPGSVGPSLFVLKNKDNKPQENQMFILELHEDNSQLAFRSCYGTYVGIARKKKGTSLGHYLVAKQHLVSNTETFQLTVKVAISLASNGYILTATRSGNFCVWTEGKIKDYECFLMEALHNGCTFYTYHKKHLTADPSGKVTASATTKMSKELFRLIPHASGNWKYYIQTWYDGFLVCENEKKIQSAVHGSCQDMLKATVFKLIPLSISGNETKEFVFIQRNRAESIVRNSNSRRNTGDSSAPTPSVEDNNNVAEDKEEEHEGSVLHFQEKKSMTKALQATTKHGTERLSIALRGSDIVQINTMKKRKQLPGEQLVLQIDNMAHILIGCALCGTLSITNYHISYQTRLVSGSEGEGGQQSLTLARDWKIGLGYISRISMKEVDMNEGYFQLYLHCKDFNVIQLSTLPGFPQDPTVIKSLERILESVCFCQDETQWIPFAYKTALLAANETKEVDPGWEIYSAEAEYERLGLTGSDDPRFTLFNNDDYSLCNTYPRKFVVPADFDATSLTAVAECRSRGRVQAIVWRRPTAPHSLLVRCSQPRTGLKRNTSPQDEQLVEMIRMMTFAEAGLKDRDLKVTFMDARPFMNAMANQLSGAGYESTSNYKHSKRMFLGIANIHVMRDCLYKLQKLALSLEEKRDSIAGTKKVLDFRKYLNKKEETEAWLEHQTLILNACVKIIKKLEAGQSVIVHCSDGWDRTPQICALVELLMDPFYRTICGFIILIEKEWMSFGHKFQERIGHGDPHYDDKERSPIFLQWIETVWQVWCQYPTSFEFNEDFLAKIVTHSYSCLYGTFLADSEREKYDRKLPQCTSSLWTHLLSEDVLPSLRNPAYESSSPREQQKHEPTTEEEGKEKEKEKENNEERTGQDLDKFKSGNKILTPHPKRVQLWMRIHFPFFQFPK